jgi:hypothetical protein
MAPYEETIYIVAILTFGAFIGWLIARYATERARERERRARVVEAQIEKFAEARDFVAFAQSEAGLAWIRADSGESRVARGLLMLGLAGILSLFLGLALLVNSAWLSRAASAADMLTDKWWGTMLVGLGVACLAAFALLTRLARAWGLGPPRSDNSRADGR